MCILSATCLFILCSFSSWLTPQKLDTHIAAQYGNQLPRQNKVKTDVKANSAYPAKNWSYCTKYFRMMGYKTRQEYDQEHGAKQ